MITGLCVHALLEGMPLGLKGDYEGFLPPFLTGIVLHNVPIAITLMIILMHAGATKLKASMILLLFAAMGPAGMLLTYFAGITLTEEWTSVYNAIIGVVIGIFLHISTTILFEASENHKFNAIRFISILAGVLTAWILVH
jgi:zinc transporter ZupT